MNSRDGLDTMAELGGRKVVQPQPRQLGSDERVVRDVDLGGHGVSLKVVRNAQSGVKSEERGRGRRKDRRMGGWEEGKMG